MLYQSGSIDMAAKCKIILILAGLLMLTACAGRGEQLLRQDYMVMTDDELLKYFYAIDEEVVGCQAAAGRTAVGVGTGYGTGGFRLGVGIQQRLATGCDLDALRQRRGEVRFELKKRGLSP
jgi:hypothetical protein